MVKEISVLISPHFMIMHEAIGVAVVSIFIRLRMGNEAHIFKLFASSNAQETGFYLLLLAPKFHLELFPIATRNIPRSKILRVSLMRRVYIISLCVARTKTKHEAYSCLFDRWKTREVPLSSPKIPLKVYSVNWMVPSPVISATGNLFVASSERFSQIKSATRCGIIYCTYAGNRADNILNWS